jgi:isopentenyl-diphosphate delta-isomerase
MPEMINLVNVTGNRIGTIEKLEAHKTGQLHEAFSIFIFNTKGELLLQKRNENKYHSGGLWTNTCCSHARVGEGLQSAIHRRLQEEMGFDCDLKEVGSFIYNVKLSNNLIENEFDYIFKGVVDDIIVKPDPEEVSDYKWISMDELKNDAKINPDIYTEWIKIILAGDILICFDSNKML